MGNCNGSNHNRTLPAGGSPQIQKLTGPLGRLTPSPSPGNARSRRQKRLPASELKIDRGFVRDLMHDTEDAAIIAAIVAVGRTRNLKIVAEGVETREQQEFLTRLGCSSLQGFLLGRPLPADQFIDAMRQREMTAA